MPNGDVTTQQVDAAIDYVIENSAVDRAQTVAYSRVFEAAGLPPPQDLHRGGESQLVTRLMERFHYRCQERELPPLDALVVHVAGTREGRPGSGYFRVNEHSDPFGERASAEQVIRAVTFWETEKRKCQEWASAGVAGRPRPSPGAEPRHRSSTKE